MVKRSKSDDGYDHGSSFRVYVVDTLHDEVLDFYGRFLTFDECVRELELLYREYCRGTFDPWCDEKSFSFKSATRTLSIMCCHFHVKEEDDDADLTNERFDYDYDYHFGFHAENGRLRPRFFCSNSYDNYHVVPDAQAKVLEKLAQKMAKEKYF